MNWDYDGQEHVYNIYFVRKVLLKYLIAENIIKQANPYAIFPTFIENSKINIKVLNEIMPHNEQVKNMNNFNK